MSFSLDHDKAKPYCNKASIAGELTAVYVPGAQDEAMRDLSRAREDAVIAGRKAKQRLNAFLLRHEMSYSGESSQLMAYLGLVPSEHSSGGSIKRGGITKTGNGHARKVLIEAAWAYR